MTEIKSEAILAALLVDFIKSNRELALEILNAPDPAAEQTSIPLTVEDLKDEKAILAVLVKRPGVIKKLVERSEFSAFLSLKKEQIQSRAPSSSASSPIGPSSHSRFDGGYRSFSPSSSASSPIGMGRKRSGGCFIATAVFGSPLSEEVGFLRRFRDLRLQSRTGKKLVRIYERHSPPLARRLESHPGLKASVRVFLIPAVRLARILTGQRRSRTGTAVIGHPPPTPGG